jgi:hypothetical protein
MHTGIGCNFTYGCYVGMHTITWMIMAQWGNHESKSWSISSQNYQFSTLNYGNEQPDSLDISLQIKHRHLLHYNPHLLLFNISLWIYVWSINTGSPYTCMATFHVWLSWSSNVLLRRWRGKKVGRSSLTHNKVHNLVPSPNLKYNSAQSLIVTFCDKNNINTFMKSGCITTVLVAVKGSAQLIQSPHIGHNPQPVL